MDIARLGRACRDGTPLGNPDIVGRCENPPPFAIQDAPQDQAAWAGWLRAGAQELIGAIGDGGPDQPVWTWQHDRTAGFWLRKMLHDEVIHRFDVEVMGSFLGDISPDVAVDGVSDWLESIDTLSRPDAGEPVFLGLVGSGETLRFEATDPGLASGGMWHVKRLPARVVWAYGHGSADAVVRAPARELLLLLNRRLDPCHEGVEIIGDRALFMHWLEHSKF
jgi:MDMPI C-terminal domain/Mycothiol maleylpyruvate isomerase N-terminal domain